MTVSQRLLLRVEIGRAIDAEAQELVNVRADLAGETLAVRTVTIDAARKVLA